MEWFYWWRYALGHYHEAMNRLAEGNDVAEVKAFVEGLPGEVRALHEEALAIHEEIVGPVSRVRNEATFHYPSERSRKALQRALEQLADETGAIEGGVSNKVKDSRMHYADDVVATLFFQALGGDEEEVGQCVARAAEGERSLMRFINHAQDIYFSRFFESGEAKSA